MEKKYYFLQPGYIFVTEENYIVETVLGSCVAVCLWDEENKIGGVNHYIYPECTNKSERTARYGNVSIPYMIKMMREKGAQIHKLKAYAIGGARNIHLSSIVGDGNIKIAREILDKYKIKLIQTDFGGIRGRKIYFDTSTGNLKIEFIKSDGIEERIQNGK